MAGCPGTQVPDCWDFRRRLDIRSLADRNKQDALSRLSIRNLEDQNNRGIPSSLGIRRPLVGSPDIRKQDTDKRDIRSLGSHTRRSDSHNRCPVAMEA
jgi:hypothetical protein